MADATCFDHNFYIYTWKLNFEIKLKMNLIFQYSGIHLAVKYLLVPIFYNKLYSAI